VGTLLDALLYPEEVGSLAVEEAWVAEALARARLEHALERWGLRVTRDWRVLLSSGEQQRLAFARLFLGLRLRAESEWPSSGGRNNTLAVLDEATGALDVETEEAMYREVRRELAPGGGLRGVLSVGHRPALREFHDTVLIIGSEPDLWTPLGGEDDRVLARGTWLAPGGNMLKWGHLTNRGAACST
jgi:putative ATP-binding cassette transporter